MTRGTARQAGRRFSARLPRGAWVLIALLTLACLWASFLFLDPIPPRRLTIASGPDGSLMHVHAQQYRELLAREGVELVERQTEGVGENLQLLADPASGVDIAFVQGGQANEPAARKLVMIASLYYQPLWIFMRHGEGVDTLTALAGRRIGTGMPGSGTHALGAQLLATSGVDERNATLVPLPTVQTRQALLGHEIDAALLVGAAETPAVREALLDPALDPVSLKFADAYAQRYRFLSRRVLQAGTISFVPLLPRQDTELVVSEAMLAARENINPALVNLLLEIIRDSHDDQGYFEAAGEFPNVDQVDLRVSPDAIRHKRFGPSLLYRYLPFWAATVVERFIIVMLPLMAVLIPLIRLLPGMVAWRVRSRIYRWYGELTLLERQVESQAANPPIQDWLADLQRIERAAERLDPPAAFASEVYTLREHIELVRRAVLTRAGEVGAGG